LCVMSYTLFMYLTARFGGNVSLQPSALSVKGIIGVRAKLGLK
jgi:hypothetical protein